MKKGFTLIEIILAIGVIGVILVLVVPQFITSFNKKTYSAALQKMYITVDQAVKQMMADDRASTLSRSTLYMTSSDTVSSTAGAFIKKYFKVEVDCGTTSMKPCFASSYKNTSLKEIADKMEMTFKNRFYCVKLDFGGAMCLSPITSDKTLIWVDVNGAKAPNIMGQDLFNFRIYDDGFVGDRDSLTSPFSQVKNNDWVIK